MDVPPRAVVGAAHTEIQGTSLPELCPHTHTHKCTKAARYLQKISRTCHRGYTAAPNNKFLQVLIVGDGVPTMLWASVGVLRAEKMRDWWLVEHLKCRMHGMNV